MTTLFPGLFVPAIMINQNTIRPTPSTCGWIRALSKHSIYKMSLDTQKFERKEVYSNERHLVMRQLFSQSSLYSQKDARTITLPSLRNGRSRAWHSRLEKEPVKRTSSAPFNWHCNRRSGDSSGNCRKCCVPMVMGFSADRGGGRGCRFCSASFDGARELEVAWLTDGVNGGSDRGGGSASFKNRGADLVIAVGTAANLADADARGKPRANARVVELVLASKRRDHVTAAQVLEAHRARVRFHAFLTTVGNFRQEVCQVEAAHHLVLFIHLEVLETAIAAEHKNVLVTIHPDRRWRIRSQRHVL